MNKMKTYIKLYLLLISVFAVVLFTSCQEEAEEPELNVIATPTTVNVGDEVVFDIVGNAETFVIYTGDPGHDYNNSYLAIAEGSEVDLESVVLTNDSLNNLLPWLEAEIDNYNSTAEAPLIFDNIASRLNNFVNKEYQYKSVAKYEITTQLMPELANIADQLVESYFEDNSVILAPDGGYHTGVALGRYNLGYTYVYNSPGTYTATVIATNISNKNYSGSGYKYNRTASASEYDFNRLIKQVTITVQ